MAPEFKSSPRMLKNFQKIRSRFFGLKIEKYLFEPEEEERIALFFAIAKRGDHFDDYKKWWPYAKTQKKCRNQIETKQIMESSGFSLESSKIYGVNDHLNIWK